MKSGPFPAPLRSHARMGRLTTPTDRAGTINPVNEYVLDHHLEGEGRRLALMSGCSIRCTAGTLASSGSARRQALEVGSGNGSISAWMAELVAPGGKRRRPRPGPVADRRPRPRPRVSTGRHPRRAGRSGRLRPGDRAGDPPPRLRRRAGDRQPRRERGPRRGDPAGRARFLPVSVAGPPAVKEFWDGWLAWSREQGIDYHIGRGLAPRLAALGLERSRAPPRRPSTTAVPRGPSIGSTPSPSYELLGRLRPPRRRH